MAGSPAGAPEGDRSCVGSASPKPTTQAVLFAFNSEVLKCEDKCSC